MSRSGRFLSAAAAVDVAHSADEGRYAVATESVKPGDLLVVEKPHASVLMSEKLGTHCTHCLKRSVARSTAAFLNPKSVNFWRTEVHHT